MSINEIIWIMFLLLVVTIYYLNAYFTIEGAVRFQKKIKIKNKLVKKILLLTEFTKEIDRVLLILDLGCVALAAYWFVITICDMPDKRCEYCLFCLVYFFFDMAAIVYVELFRMKEKNNKPYHREEFELQEETFDILEGTYHCVYTTNKRKIDKKAVVIFWPSSYYMFQDVEGYGYGYDAVKNELKRLSNIGAYVEVSDYLVHCGYDTLRIEASRTKSQNMYTIAEVAADIDSILNMMKPDKKRILLLHGPSNRLLSEIYQNVTLAGCISLCGAAMSYSAEIEQLASWVKANKNKPQRLERQIMFENPVLSTEQMRLKKTEELLEELYFVADRIPIFIGYVEQDPYYSNSIVKEIKHDNITTEYFEKTDFTLRECGVNKKVHYDGYLDENLIAKWYNQKLPEKICEWLRTSL